MASKANLARTLKTILARPVRFSHGYLDRRPFSKVSALPPELESSFNKQITTEFFASFTYLAMATFFARQNVCLVGCSKYFMNQVFEEREHAHKLIDYLNRRGSTVTLQTIKAPENQQWDSPLAAFQEALELEKHVSEEIFQLHKLANECNDVCSCVLLENDFLETQVEEYDKVSRYVAQLEQIGADGPGIYIFDKYLLKDSSKES